jgi:hypothetical protein
VTGNSLQRALDEYFRTLDSLGRTQGVSQLAELAYLKVLVTRYPGHARQMLDEYGQAQTGNETGATVPQPGAGNVDQRPPNGQGTASMSKHPKVVFLLVWESKTAGDAVRALLDELGALHRQVELFNRKAADWRRKGDFLAARSCADTAQGIEHAALGIEEALFDAFDLWEQYEQQDP